MVINNQILDMKKLFKYSLLLLSVAAAFVACKDEEKSDPGTWDANPNYADIYFKETTKSIQLDPTEATKATITIYRRDSVGDRTVHLDIIENTDDVFTVADAVFADQESSATFEVNFPNAEIGKKYTLTLSTSDPNLVSSYSQNISYTLDITRIKWNLLGKGTLEETFVFGGAGEFDIYIREDDPSKFRFDNLFVDIAKKTNTALDGNQTEQAFVSVLKAGDSFAGVTISQANLIGFLEDINTGFAHPTYGADILICHPYGFGSTATEDAWLHNKVLVYQENGLPGQIQIAPFYYMNGVGGWNMSQRDGYVVITFPGYTPDNTYEAQFDDDFAWQDVKTFDITNSATGETAPNIMLQKAVCTVTTDDCDVAFLEKYGVPYRLLSPFAEDNDIYFFIKNGRVTIPADFAEYFALQNTGLTTAPLNTPIYAMINAKESEVSITETEEGVDITELILNMTFTDEEGEKDYGTADVLLNNVTWSQIAGGTYSYYFFGDVDEETHEITPYVDDECVLEKRDDKEDIFRIPEWGYGVDFEFTWDRTTNEVSVPLQFSGFTDNEGYTAYCWEAPDFAEVITSFYNYYEVAPASVFDPETNTIVFSLVYLWFSPSEEYAGWDDLYQETFELQLDESGEVKSLKRLKNHKNNIVPVWQRKMRKASKAESVKMRRSTMIKLNQNYRKAKAKKVQRKYQRINMPLNFKGMR